MPVSSLRGAGLVPSLCILTASVLCGRSALAVEPGLLPAPVPIQAGDDLIDRVSGIAGNANAVNLCRNHGYGLTNLTWEDTGRAKESCWGPNISDLTIQVQRWDGRPLAGTRCMPVMRKDNFSDVSADVPMDQVRLLVGNECGAALHPVPLGDYLAQLPSYLSIPSSGTIVGSLRLPRDQVVLASAQACLLPVPATGEVGFTPVLFNYQSSPGNPAVLAILATPEGTSAQIIDGRAELSAGVWHGQRLFADRAGQRAPLRAQRASTVAAQLGVPVSALPAGLDLVMVIQVPLVQHWAVRAKAADEDGASAAPAAAPAPLAGAPADCTDEQAGMESAVISAGPVEGPFPGLGGYTLERDPRFPIRVTVQFYQATDSATVSDADVARMAAAIDQVYLDANSVGSLVTAGWTNRPTETTSPPPVVMPVPAPMSPGWLSAGWVTEVLADHQRRSGVPTSLTCTRLRTHFGAEWVPADARELRNAIALSQDG